MSSAGATDSPQVKVALSFVEGVDKRDVKNVAKLLHKDYRHIPYPRSMGRAVENKDEWLQRIKDVMEFWTDDCKSTVHSIIEVPGKVVVHYTAKVGTSFGMESDREMLLIAHIVTDEDGSLKIKDLENFIDSKAFLDFAEAAAAAKANT